ncbi:hypothetical protein GBF38_022301 [Nibea albiflora]|uniref:Uncharacterized protein n=1 Tax=Nibea albiflora TaxID=240163 RepID=A0ACB7FLA6_NIBAL|nr:hypothetical protein GBF38_022301 [Nibea albiflora]
MGKMLFLEGVQQGQRKRLDEQCCRGKSVNVQALENYDEWEYTESCTLLYTAGIPLDNSLLTPPSSPSLWDGLKWRGQCSRDIEAAALKLQLPGSTS